MTAYQLKQSRQPIQNRSGRNST